jgi:hypothetical protein
LKEPSKKNGMMNARRERRDRLTFGPAAAVEGGSRPIDDGGGLAGPVAYETSLGQQSWKEEFGYVGKTYIINGLEGS